MQIQRLTIAHVLEEVSPSASSDWVPGQLRTRHRPPHSLDSIRTECDRSKITPAAATRHATTLPSRGRLCEAANRSQSMDFKRVSS